MYTFTTFIALTALEIMCNTVEVAITIVRTIANTTKKSKKLLTCFNNLAHKWKVFTSSGKYVV